MLILYTTPCCCTAVWLLQQPYIASIWSYSPGERSCYAIVVLADNATFSLVVKSMAAFSTQAANRSYCITFAAAAQLVENLSQNHDVVGSCPTWSGFSYMFVPTSAYAVGTELSDLGFRERATLIPHSCLRHTLHPEKLASKIFGYLACDR